MSGLLALLEEDSPRLKVHALQKLHELVDQFWSEVAAAVPLIEELSEDESFEVSGCGGCMEWRLGQSIQSMDG